MRLSNFILCFTIVTLRIIIFLYKCHCSKKKKKRHFLCSHGSNQILRYKIPELLPSFLARLDCDDVGVSDFLFTAIVVAVVDAEVEDTVVVGVEVGLVAVMGFMVADTGFTARISALSGVLSFDLNTKEEQLLLVFFFGNRLK